MEQRISTTTASRLLRVSKSTIQRQIKAGNLKAEMQKVSQGGGNCGMSNMIPVSEVLQQLDTQGRLLWYESQSGLSTQVSAADLATYKEAFGEEGLTELANRQQAVMALDGILNSGERGRTAAMDALAGTLGVTSRTLRRWHAAYKERGLAAIMDRVERRDKGQSRTCCQLARDFIEAQMCDNRKFPQTLVLERLRERAAEYGENACNCCVYCDGSDARRALRPADREKYPICTMASGSMMIPANRHAVNRIVETMDKAQMTFARYGKRAWEAAYMQKTKRSKPTMTNEVWFGDHHKIDLFVLDENDNLVRPWMTAWMDACSKKFVGWELTLEPNSDTVADSFCRAAVYTKGSDVHGLPRYIYIDNGKDYRSHRFEGETLVETDLGCLNAEFSEKEGLLRALGVGVHHALPYRGTLEDFVREFPGWCGDSPEERPEDNGRILSRMKERGELMTFETFAKCFAEKLLPKYENHIGEDGLSPDQRYRQAEKARADTPDWATMAIFKSQSAKRVVTTQGVRLNNQLFWHPEMADIIREQVTIYYNRGYNPSVSVFSGGHFVCEAEPVELMALIDPDEERVAAHMADQKRQQRKVTDRLAYIRQSTKRITREAYAEEIDEQRQRMATVTSLEAARAGKAKQQVADKAAGRRKAASAGENAVRSMIAANGEKLLKRSAR